MSILVVGSAALDTVETPFGTVEDALGGSAIYFSAAASYFAPVNLVAVVGDDFPKEKIEFLKKKNVDFSGLEVADGKTFRWGGKYGFDLNDRDTLFTHLNVFEKFEPKIPNSYKNSEYIFLANIGPDLQMDVLKQIQSPKLVALDTMNYWIGGDLPALRETLKHVDVLIVNDSEVRQLAYEANLVKASKIVQEMGPKTLIIKKGEHGALLITQDSFFWAPAYPLEFIYDPTGAGDTFAGGFMGYMAKSDDISIDNLKRAVVFGSTMASFCVEKFSLERLENLTEEEIRKRFYEFWQMTNFDPNV
ncbi:sugar kinase [candidate division KSB1 bacterium]|nr:sugar kinase [candidate division KSB1 bacterium]